MTEFGYRLIRALEAKRMSQSDLARATDTSIMSISRYINTEREPSIEVLRKICRCLGVSSDYLLGIDGDLNSFDKLLTICKTAGLTTEQRMMLVKALIER